MSIVCAFKCTDRGDIYTYQGNGVKERVNGHSACILVNSLQMTVTYISEAGSSGEIPKEALVVARPEA